MKEFYLVPTHEMEDLQNSNKSVDNDNPSLNPQRKEQILFNNGNINKEAKLELQGHMNRLVRKSKDHKNKIIAYPTDNVGSVNEVDEKYFSYMRFIFANVPNGFEQNAYNLVSKLEKSGVIKTNDDGGVTLNSTDKEIKLKDLLRAIFVCNGKVSHIKKFLTNFVLHLDKDIIRNKKLIKLIDDVNHIKREYDSSSEDDNDKFHDTMSLEDNALNLRGSGVQVTNKLIPWIIY